MAPLTVVAQPNVEFGDAGLQRGHRPLVLFELQGYFVRANVPYRPPGGGYDSSDIDIVALHPITGDGLACEVKGWHTEWLTMSCWKDWPLLNFTCEPATAAVRNLIGDRSFRHVLVVPPLGPRNPAEVFSSAAEHRVELLQWPDLLSQMTDTVSIRKSARNATDHLLRVLRVYDLLPATGGEAPPEVSRRAVIWAALGRRRDSRPRQAETQDRSRSAQ